MHSTLSTCLCLALWRMALPCAGSDWPHWRGPSRDGKAAARRLYCKDRAGNLMCFSLRRGQE